ncbi:MAG: hypothetical protein KME13_11375 [Myxacorys californica WJT36-NPBG1]|jgi:hypothetical protein|nr:hypothetical protein [Myxacorys californica WJT36-NPBG1]
MNDAFWEDFDREIDIYYARLEAQSLESAPRQQESEEQKTDKRRSKKKAKSDGDRPSDSVKRNEEAPQ